MRWWGFGMCFQSNIYCWEPWSKWGERMQPQLLWQGTWSTSWSHSQGFPLFCFLPFLLVELRHQQRTLHEIRFDLMVRPVILWICRNWQLLLLLGPILSYLLCTGFLLYFINLYICANVIVHMKMEVWMSQKFNAKPSHIERSYMTRKVIRLGSVQVFIVKEILFNHAIFSLLLHSSALLYKHHAIK